MPTLDSDPNAELATVQSTLWLIDDDPALRLILADTFSDAQMTVISFTQAKAAWTRLNDVLQSGDRSILPDAILTDIRMPLMDGLSFSDWVHKHFPDLPIIIMTAHSDLQSAVDSYQTGAFDYLPKPFDLDDAIATVKKAIKPRVLPADTTTQAALDSKNTHDNNSSQSSDAVADTIKQSTAKSTKSSQQSTAQASRVHSSASKQTTKSRSDYTAPTAESNTRKISTANPNTASSVNNNPNGIIGQSAAMQTVFRAIGRLSQSPITVLITGESGTGKELVANALHQHSPRRKKSFIALNMAAIPHDLIESELFGHEKGAFTGASTMRQGRFEQANGGTLFLDEIGDMPFSTQTRLLRVLANGEFYRVGGQKPIKVDVRIIAATHQNLERLVKLGKFREDLFYRLNVIRLPLPPLRQRREDIPALVTHFMQRAAKEMSTEQKYIEPEALAIMQAFDWSGNVRQIENVCRWLTVMATGDTVLADDLPPELIDFVNQRDRQPSPNDHPTNQPLATDLQRSAMPHSSNTSERTPTSFESGSIASTTASVNQHVTTSTGDTATAPHPNHQSVSNPAPNSAFSTHDSQDSQNLENKPTPLTTDSAMTWQQSLERWAHRALTDGETEILQIAAPEFERVLLNVALTHTKGRKGDAALLLGWGRNTLTRKLKQLDIH